MTNYNITIQIIQDQPINVQIIESEPIICNIEGGIGGEGNMTKEIYDTDNDGVVDETEKVDGGSFV